MLYISWISFKTSYRNVLGEWRLGHPVAHQVVAGYFWLDCVSNNVLDPWRGLVAEICQAHSHHGVSRGQQPQEYDGEEAEHAEQDQDTPGVNDGADKKQQAENGKQTWNTRETLLSKRVSQNYDSFLKSWLVMISETWH